MSGDLVAKLRAKRRSRVNAGYGETGRVLGLPTAKPVTRHDDLLARLALERPGGERRLRPLQVEMLVRASRAGGLLAGVGVGHGKTLVTLLVSRLIPCERPLLLVPSMRVYDKTLREALEYDEDFLIDERLEIMTYGQLSGKAGEATLLQLRPDLIIADEAHCLADLTSARTGRVKRYVKDFAPGFVALTGTLVKHSLRDYAHLAEWALGAGSPLPRRSDYRALERWALCVDADNGQQWPTKADWRSMQALVDRWGRAEDCVNQPVRVRRQLVREAYHRRLTSTEGVVMTEDRSSDVKLTFSRLTAPAVPSIVQAQRLLETKWQRPDGELLRTALEVGAVARQLALGFYYYWDWPGGVKDWQWLDARAAWHAELRRVLKRPMPGRDTPALVITNIEQGGKLSQDAALVDALERWRRVADRPVPPTKVTWLSTAVIEHALEHARATFSTALLWYSDDAVADLLERLGVKVVRGGEEPPLTADGLTALSVTAHGTAFNLQQHANNLIIGAPSSAHVNEQLLGRTDRSGQTSDVRATYLVDVEGPLANALAKALKRAKRIEQAEGQKQRLLLGEWA